MRIVHLLTSSATAASIRPASSPEPSAHRRRSSPVAIRSSDVVDVLTR
ncbi:hypothetical protein [Arthrobacter sp. RIT-PI-e]|nr:hypothetical protein [Arthrobacter sp. RIT-PI-e]